MELEQPADSSDSFQEWLKCQFDDPNPLTDTGVDGQAAARLYREQLQGVPADARQHWMAKNGGSLQSDSVPGHVMQPQCADSELQPCSTASAPTAAAHSVPKSSSVDHAAGSAARTQLQGGDQQEPLPQSQPQRQKQQQQAQPRQAPERKDTTQRRGPGGHGRRTMVAELEAEVMAKTQHLARLQKEHADLLTKHRMLETAVTASEETLDIIRLVDGLSLTHSAERGKGSTGSSSHGSDPALDQLPAGDAAGAPSAAGGAAGPSTPAATGSAAAAAGNGACAEAGQDTSVLTPADQQQRALQAAGLVSDWATSLQVYKDFVGKVALLLHRADVEQERTAVFAELETLTWSTINTLKPWLAYKGQELVYEWQGRNLETGQQDDTSQLWPHVLTQLQVTEEQARSLSACYAMFGTCLERLVEERQQLAAAYGFIQEQLEAEKHGGGPLDATKMAEQLSVSLQLLKRMKGNMDAYGSLDKVFATSVTRTLTGVQVAKAIMHSYPYLPSWHDMISHLRKPIGSA